MIDVYALYFITALMNIIVFSTTFLVLFHKFRKKKVKANFWASMAFLFLVLQEAVVLYWIFDFLSGGVLFYSRPWHIQALAVFFSFNLLGLSMAGKIKD